MIRLTRGLDLPIAGVPAATVSDSPAPKSVALLGGDYPGMRPTLHVAEGDTVRLGQLLFEDKKTPGVRYTSPAAGRVAAINRGHRRFMQSVVIDIDPDGGNESFDQHDSGALPGLDRDAVQAQLLASGEWTAIRTRPFGRVPVPGAVPEAIFVPVIDTHPLAAPPSIAINEQLDAFRDGLTLLARLTDGPVWVCRGPNTDLPAFSGGQVREETFEGPHPAGNPGTHIHFLHPVGRRRSVWVVGYQDVIAFGRLFTTGRLHTDRLVSLGGPQVGNPRLLRTRVGASLESLTAGELDEGGGQEDAGNRIISGSVFNGHHAQGPTAYLGRLANQVTVLREGTDRPMLGYLSPGLRRHSVLNIYLSRLWPGRRLPMSTSTNGSERAMVPLGQYEKLVPMDILPTQLLRALVVGDVETAEALGALELVEEDLALCSYACVGKYEYGPILRDTLTRIEQEG